MYATMTTMQECHKLLTSAKEDAQLTRHLHQAVLSHFEDTLSKLEERAKLPKREVVPEQSNPSKPSEGHRLTKLVRFLQSSS